MNTAVEYWRLLGPKPTVLHSFENLWPCLPSEEAAWWNKADTGSLKVLPEIQCRLGFGSPRRCCETAAGRPSALHLPLAPFFLSPPRTQGDGL